MKGHVEVIKKELEASFSWKPGDTGTEWDLDSLRSLLTSADIRVEVDEADLEQALTFFNENREPGETEPVARGVAPVAPIPTRANLAPAELPGDVAASLDAILEGAPPAEGDDDPTYGWAEAGSVIGTVTAAVAPRAGIALNRDPIAAPEPSGENFRIGDHLETHGAELTALETGILRFSDAGADVIPCRRHTWLLDGGMESGGCFLDYQPGHEALAPPSVTDIVMAASKIGFLPEKIMPEEELRGLLAGAASDEKPLVGHPISIDTDGRTEIVVNSMKTKAVLSLRRETGDGLPLELPVIAAAIRNSGLRGLDGDAVKSSIMEFWKSGAIRGDITLKMGRIPERGPDREVEFLVPFLEEQDAAPVRERLEFEPDRVRGLLSLRDFPPSAVSKMAIVEAGQQVGRLAAPRAGKAGRDIYGNELPGFPGNDPDIRTHEGLEWDGDVLVARAGGVLDVGATMDGRTHVRIRPHKDAAIQVTVSNDRIKAFLSLRLPVGTGAPADADRIRNEAEKAGVIKGFLDDAIQDAVERSLDGEIITGVLIAEGRLPMEGNTRLSLAVSGDPAKAAVPVKAGDVIGTILQGDDGGWNVLGEPLMDDGGTLSVGECIIREEKDGETTLIAEKGGHLVMSDGGLVVKHLLDYVGDVSLASGNIRFPGRIKIDGSVLSRVIVDGGEGVEVTQVVQAALLNSGGDVKIGKGIKGEGKAVVRSQGELTLGYAEEANLLTTGNIRVTKALMNCRVKCNGRLEIPGNEGRIIGGVMKLKDGLTCADVGNERGAETVVSFGQDYLVENQIDQVQKELEKLQDFIAKTDGMMADLERKPGSGKKLIMVRQKKVDALKMLEKKNLRLFLLREKFERHFESEIRITGTAWPGTTFESHGRIIKVESPLKSTRIFFDRELGRMEKKPI